MYLIENLKNSIVKGNIFIKFFQKYVNFVLGCQKMEKRCQPSDPSKFLFPGDEGLYPL
jgi:hypothetical protein